MISNLIFRVGGYIYRVLMARLLGPEGYGLVGLTLPFQGVFSRYFLQGDYHQQLPNMFLSTMPLAKIRWPGK